jgi:hypothetical protein
MRIRNIIDSRPVSAGILVLVFFATSMAATDVAWAKHKKVPVKSNADPCASPTAFVKDHVQKIRTLQAALATRKSTVFGMFSSNLQSDPDTAAKISDLRHDADGVNDLLRAGGCTPIDIDTELKSASAAPAQAPEQSKKHKHQ